MSNDHLWHDCCDISSARKSASMYRRYTFYSFFFMTSMLYSLSFARYSLCSSGDKLWLCFMWNLSASGRDVVDAQPVTKQENLMPACFRLWYFSFCASLNPLLQILQTCENRLRCELLANYRNLEEKDNFK